MEIQEEAKVCSIAEKLLAGRIQSGLELSGDDGCEKVKEHID